MAELLTQTGAGRLYYKLAFDKRQDEEDEYGNVVSSWVEQFQRRARFVLLRGSEAVMQGRLAGRQTIEVQVRKDQATKLIDHDWQARDVRRNIAYNVRDIRESLNRADLIMLLESGVAT
jgi:head-tail adaptor